MYKPFPFRIDHKLEKKLTILGNSLKIKDLWILLDGDEGSGKTNMAAYLLYFFHCMTGREFTVENFFFDSNKMLDLVKSNSNLLINWDEAALGGLSSEWWTQSQVNLIKFAMVGRVKHHIFVLCIPRFTKLKEDLRLDRIHAMIHMDLGRKGNKFGHYAYLTKRGIKNVNRLWQTKHIRAYNKCTTKYGGFYGDIPYIFDKVFTQEEQNKYDRMKHQAIDDIGKKKTHKDVKKLLDLKEKFASIKLPGITQKDLCNAMGISPRTLQLWRQKSEIEADSLEDLGTTRKTKAIINDGTSQTDNLDRLSPNLPKIEDLEENNEQDT